MSGPKFMVFKLNDLKIPVIMLLVAIVAFTVFMWSGNDVAATFAPDDSYADGMYIANIAFTDADMDVVVEVKDKQITSISLDGFDETERTLYKDINSSVSFVNDYITSTQSVELPETSNISASTSILMDAVRVALSEDNKAMLTTTYEVPLLEAITEETATDDALAEDAISEEAVSEEAVSEEASVEDETATEDVMSDEVITEDEAVNE